MCASGSAPPSCSNRNTPAGSATASCPYNRAMLCQETPMSCGIASTRMLVSSITNNNVPEATLRQQSQNYAGNYTAANGTRMDNMQSLLTNNGVPNQFVSGQTMSSLQAATACGKPAIIHFNNPGGGGHFMVLDTVRTNPDGTQTAVIRDPWCGGGPSAASPASGTREMSATDLANRGFSGAAVTTCP